MRLHIVSQMTIVCAKMKKVKKTRVNKTKKGQGYYFSKNIEITTKFAKKVFGLFKQINVLLTIL